MKVRLPFLVPGVILILLGALWALQGAGVVRQGFMSGQKLWLGVGIVLVIVGLGLGYLGLAPRTARA